MQNINNNEGGDKRRSNRIEYREITPETDLKVITKNIRNDLYNLFHFNFVQTKRGFIPIIGVIGWRIYKNFKFMKLIKSNRNISDELIKKNMMIKVRPLEVVKLEEKNSEEGLSVLSVNFSHIPSFNYIPISNSNSNNDSKLEMKLAGIDGVSKEGEEFLNKLFKSQQEFKFYLKFNNKEENTSSNTTSNNGEYIYAWLLFQNKSIFTSLSPTNNNINLNVFLAEKGYCKISNINTDNIYDEEIYYYMSDLLDAEKKAKIEANGIWSNRRTGVAKDYSNNADHNLGVIGRVKKSLNMMKAPKWQKILLRRNINH